MNLVTLLAEWARQHPERPALVDTRTGRDRVVTFGDLWHRVEGGSRTLQQWGLRRGQVILVHQPVSIELYEILLSAMHAGLRVMLADPAAGRLFLELCCRRLQPDACFGPWRAQWLRLAVPGLRGTGMAIRTGCWFPGTRAWRTDSGIAPIAAVPDDEPALVTFTSGSTGVPKAAVRTHGFLLAQHRTLSRALDFADGEVDLVTLPVFVLANLASGLTSVLAATDLSRPGAPDAAAIRGQCERHAVTRCSASPAFFEGLLKAPGGMPGLGKIFSGGAPVYPDLLRRLRQALPNTIIQSVYGSTEAEPIAHCSAHEGSSGTEGITRRGGGLCAGLPVPEIQLKIIAGRWGEPLGPLNRGEFSKLEVPSGQAGEIVVTGEHVLRGYLEGLGDSENKIRVEDDIWHRTGDAGWLDAAGRLWLLGRGAEKMPPFAAGAGLPADALSYPFAVECAMREAFPLIRMAAIAWQGRRLLVVGKPGQAQETAAIRAKAEEFGMAEIRHLDHLPLDPRHQAKIDYPALRGILQGRPGL